MACKPPTIDITREKYDAVLFDLDGVVTKTAKVHAASWRRLFDEFLEAARRLGVSPMLAVVLEDALSGVLAGKRGKFGCVIGVDRVGQAGALKENGADIVVSILSELTVEGKLPIWEHNMEIIPLALESMDDIRRLLTVKRPFVALDYDGTLTPIVERPELAILSDEMRSALTALANQCTVAVISGRDLSDVKGLVGIDNLFYAGSHGFDISGPAGRRIAFQQGKEFLPALDLAEKSLQALLGDTPGAQIERKKFSIAVHYRRVEKDRVQVVEEAVDQVLAEHTGLRKGTGKKVFELQPKIDWHKGKALCWLMDALDLDRPDVIPFYIGDDVTDEDAFRVLQAGGIGVVVKDDDAGELPRRTTARYALDDCGEVQQFLEALTETLQGESR